jgi:hypothetical protein
MGVPQNETTRRHLLAGIAGGAGLLGASAIFSAPVADAAEQHDSGSGLEGGWRARVTIASGPIQGVGQFLFTYARGGGLVESSNFDEMPPVPPAYGSWVNTRGQTFQSTYVFFTTVLADANDVGAGWQFSGSGKIKESIQLRNDGDTYSSDLTYQLFDTEDQPLRGQSGVGKALARRIRVEF